MIYPFQKAGLAAWLMKLAQSRLFLFLYSSVQAGALSNYLHNVEKH